MEVHGSARKHGVADQDTIHAIDHAIAFEDAGEEPDRWLAVGPDRAGNLLEVIVLITARDPSSRFTRCHSVASIGGCSIDDRVSHPRPHQLRSSDH